MAPPQSWSISLESCGRGIDNTHIDVYLGASFRKQATETVRKLIREDVSARGRRVPEHLVSGEDLGAFRERYLDLFQQAVERLPRKGSLDALVLLQLALVKFLLRLTASEIQSLERELRSARRGDPVPIGPQNLVQLRHLVTVTRESRSIHRRVLQLLFREVRKLETGALRTLRSSAIDVTWPIPDTVLFNPLLPIADLGAEHALTADYPITWIGETGCGDWLPRTSECLNKAFAPFLPGWIIGEAPPAEDEHADGEPYERTDQGQLCGFLAAEILLARFVSRREYLRGANCWIDDPANLSLFLNANPDRAGPREFAFAMGATTRWSHPDWPAFNRELVEQLHAGLLAAGLQRPIELAYSMNRLRGWLGQTLPLRLVQDYLDGRLTRRTLEQRLALLRTNLDAGIVQRALEKLAAGLKRQSPRERDALLDRYIVDFLGLRRDLKLAFKTFEALDTIRLVETEDETWLSRANLSLFEFPSRGESGPQMRRIGAHAVIKADLRGSTLITEELRARGLNPASHFSINFFDPVNRLLPEFGAEKLFIEGDAVILTLYEYSDEGRSFLMARACRLARRILQVVTLQNVLNRKHDLPELELGLGIAFSRREPNFLYDDGRRIMISNAISRADRLSSCSSLLRRTGFQPTNPEFRVAVVRDTVGGSRAEPSRDLLSYNVNGIVIDDTAFLRLHEEIPLQQLRLPLGESPESLFFVGHYPDTAGRTHWLVVRHAPVCDWYGDTLGPHDAERRHYFELIVDEILAARVRKLLQAAHHSTELDSTEQELPPRDAD